MLENFIYAKQKSLFEEALNNGEVLDEAIVFIEDTKEIWNHGTYFDGNAVDLSNIEASIQDIINKANNLKEFLYNITELTYSELKALVDNSELIPGHNYAITDYTCIYRQPTSKAEMEIPCPDVKYIICTASTTNTLLEDVLYVRNDGYLKIIECKYTIDPLEVTWTRGLTTLQPKGAVYYMKDIKGNICNYDFKHVKFRRWAVTDITPNTTPDDGATYPCSPYSVYTTTSAKPWDDGRMRIGSGQSNDVDLINGVFSGKWINSTPECKKFFGSTDENPVEFSDQYVLESVKPYLDTNHPRNKYLAWTPNMNSSSGFAPTSRGTGITSGHQAVVTTDPNDYIDLYTFDCNGEDASEMGSSNGRSTGRIHSVEITRWGMLLAGLPDTVFIITTSLTSVVPSSTLFLQNVKIEDAFNNTILLLPTTGYNFAQWIDVEIKDMQKNLLITQQVNRCRWYSLFKNNLLVGRFLNFNAIYHFLNSVLFGLYDHVELGGHVHNLLWYGVNENYRTTTSGNSYISDKDGIGTYEVETEGNFYSNILAPMLYCKFSAHCNTNTFRAPYMKGVQTHGVIQHASFGELKWGIDLNYGSGLGMYYGNIKSGTVLDTFSFASNINSLGTASGSQIHNYIFKNTLTQLPDLINTHVIAYYGDSLKLANLSDEEKAMLASTLPTELIWHEDDEYWTVNYRQDSVVGNGINKLVKMTQTEYDALTTKDDNTLYVITE